MSQTAKSFREFAMDVLATAPCRWLFGHLERRKSGVSLLNRLSYPRGLFGSFEDAWHAARNVTYAGHDHPVYLRNQAKLAGVLRSSDYPVLYWLSRTKGDPLRVLDYGGSVGNIYYSYAEHLRRLGREVEWVVFDLPRVVEEGRRIAAERGEKKLRFVSSMTEIEGEFIVHVSSAFHYWERSVAEFLTQLPLPPVHIIVNRIPVNKTEADFITVQHKQAYAVPCLVRYASKFISDFAAAGYVLVDSWSSPERRLRMPLFPNHDIPAYSGFYFCRQDVASNAQPINSLQAA